MSWNSKKSDLYDSLDEAKHMFEELPKREPTLEMALREAGVQNYVDVLHEAMEIAYRAKEKNPEIAALGLTENEAAAISCYTLDLPGVKSPYHIINESLSISRNRNTIASTRRFIYLFLSGLRKLPRFRPSAGQMLYRGIRARVPTSIEEANGHQFYAKGRTVTWWGFTTTLPSFEVTSMFIKDALSSTLFNVGGKDLWGYKINELSVYPPDEEILIEPEAKMLVNGVASLGNTLVIDLSLQPFDHLVLEDIIPPQKVDIVPSQKPQIPQKKIVCPDVIEFQNHFSLDKVKMFFKGLIRRKPTLEEALEEAGVQNTEKILDKAMEFANRARENPEIAALDLTDDEAGAITCYTLDVFGGKPPYKIINETLYGTRDESNLYSTGKLIYLFLSGLRKLPRFRLSPGQVLYRGLGIKVPTNEEEANGHQFYAKDRTVTWWGFTSTTPSLDGANAFIKCASAGTLFNVGGEDLWGYKISAFSPYPKEDETVLEPEAKMLVNGVASLGNTLVVNLALQPFDHLVLEDIIPPKAN